MVPVIVYHLATSESDLNSDWTASRAVPERGSGNPDEDIFRPKRGRCRGVRSSIRERPHLHGVGDLAMIGRCLVEGRFLYRGDII